jgi:hypothetical protein
MFEYISGGLPSAKGIFFLLLCINTPIASQEDLDIIKGVLFKSSSLKKRDDHNLNICGAIFSKNKCIISTGNDLGNLIDVNSNKMLLPLIPKIKYKYKLN